MRNSILALTMAIGVTFNGYAASQEINIYVSTSGNDLSNGSKEAPVATLSHALELVVEKGTVANDIDFHIILAGGTYYLPSTAIISEKIAGNPNSHLYIEAEDGEMPVLSGAIPVAEWRDAGAAAGLPDIAVGKVLVADVSPTEKQYRQMWVNGNRASKASNHDDLSLPRIISKDAEGKGLVVPALTYDFRNPKEVETTIIQDWAMNILRVKSIKTEGDRSYLKFGETETEIEFKRPWPILRADEQSFSNHFFKLSNAIELLNRPREWYSDANEGKLYYWPAYGETAENIKVEVPVLETILAIEGTKENPVRNVTFRGITFSHSTWMRPAEAGHVALQAGLFLWDAYSQQTATANNVAWVGRPASGVSVSNATDIVFEGCRFEHLGSTGLDFVTGVKNATVRGSVFNDIGGNGILAGFYGDEEFEVHQAWNPEDSREVCDNILIDNNYISHPAIEDWGCLAVAVGYASNITISHNEIFDTPYSAINMGWGWVKDESIMRNNHIIGNYIHSFSNQMRDSGAIYTLSSQPGSSIIGNRIEGVGDPHTNPVMWDMRHSQFDLYTDEGTDYYTVKDNWCERGEISRNQNGSHNTWGNNGPGVAESVKLSAGLEEAYRHLPSTVMHPVRTPADSIADTFDRKDPIDYISPSDGFKLGTSKAVDLNNDGLPDIVYCGGESFQVQHGGVRMNMDNYHFAATQPLHRLFMGNFDAGDLDGDGNVDLIQAGWDFWSSYNALLHNDGNGTLSETVLKSTDTAPACGITDLNCDGLPDYFFIGNGSATSFNYQNSDRTFSSQSRIITGLPGGFSDPNVIYGDFNNDGFVDLWILSNKTGGVFTEIFWNNGKGRFSKG
ncbi:MAG: FG-GAP-like repeat-containing protein [Muribaculaceae bacterium]|nr:FG-GAP-like repeat-containing protein [Muribaculaceae bacterium]